jgi:cytosine/uracil/thiamine/allantoin permease
MSQLDERAKKESLRKAVRSLIFGVALISGATTVLLVRKVQGLEDFDYAFGIIVGFIAYVFFKKVTGYKGKYDR